MVLLLSQMVNENNNNSILYSVNILSFNNALQLLLKIYI